MRIAVGRDGVWRAGQAIHVPAAGRRGIDSESFWEICMRHQAIPTINNEKKTEDIHASVYC